MTTSEKIPIRRVDDTLVESLAPDSSRTIVDRTVRGMPAPDGVIGRMLGGRFRVVRRIGEGGMGSVYEVVGSQGARFAAKVVSREALAASASPDFGPVVSVSELKRTLRRFVREAEAVQEVRSDHVVRAIELGVDDELGLPFIVMELLTGTDLGALIRERAPLDPVVVARIGVEAARGLAAAHAAGIVHRDVKPSNIFLHSDGSSVTVKVCDFGIAKQVINRKEEASNELTHTGGVLGSPRYMSPEQVTSARHADAASDVWSLCASLFEAAGGQPLWRGRSSLAELIVAICTERVPVLATEAPWIPRSLAGVIQQGLERARNQRWQSMEELIRALLPHADSGPLRLDQLTRYDVDAAPARISLPPEPLSELDALDPGFQTQGVGRPAPSATSTPSAASVTADSPRRSRVPSAWLAVAALIAIGSTAVALGVRRTPPVNEVRTIESSVMPELLRVSPPDVRVTVNGRPTRVTSGRVELPGQPGDAFDVVVEHSGRSKRTRVYITRTGSIEPGGIELPAAPAKHEESPLRLPSAAAGTFPPAPRPVIKSARAASPSSPARAVAPGEREQGAVAPSEPKPIPTVLAPKEQW